MANHGRGKGAKSLFADLDRSRNVQFDVSHTSANVSPQRTEAQGGFGLGASFERIRELTPEGRIIRRA
jgi:hypothetical protein